MIATIAHIFRGYNWYDALVPAVLLFGAWDGWEAPFTEKIFSVIEMTLALIAGISWYAPLGARLESILGMSSAASRPTAFIAIAILVRLASVLVQHLAHRQLLKVRFQRFVDMVGSPLAGFVWAGGLMIWISLALCLTGASFFHEQIARNSKFGAAVISRVPAAALTMTKHLPAQPPQASVFTIQEDLHAEDIDFNN